LIDVAYKWNDELVEKSNQAELEEFGSGDKWLKVILCSCAALFISVITFIAYLYNLFDCTLANTVTSLTIVFIVATTALQLSGDEGSLLTSSIISLYGCYLCFSALSRNPDSDCNPFLGDSNTFDIITGIMLSFVTLVWTGYAMTAEKRLSAVGMRSNSIRSDTEMYDVNLPFIGDDDGEVYASTAVPLMLDDSETDFQSKQQETNKISPLSTEKIQPRENRMSEEEYDEQYEDVWKLNMVLVLLSCWIAVSLTGWGVLEDGEGDASNPQAGHVSCWMIITSQWVCFSLYAWTLIAPRIFPDRDFS